MKIKVPGSELNRMMKTITQCIDVKHQTMSNIMIVHDNNLLTIRGTNGSFAAVMTTPVLGGDGESFCVDGGMFAKVVAMCTGDTEISTEGNRCTIKGVGRTRIPIVEAKIPNYERVNGKQFDISASDFARAYNGVAYAVSQDQSRITLTGVLMDSEDNTLRFVALDGFRMAVEEITGEFDGVRMVVPGTFMKLIATSTFPGDVIRISTNGKKVQAETDGVLISCTLLADEFPDYKRILPTEFKTDALVGSDLLRNAMKNSGVVCSTNNLVKLIVEHDKMIVMGNSEEADYDAEIPCEMLGDVIKIAFNLKYMIETINSVSAESIVLHFNSPTTPCIMHGKDENGTRLVLPVRVQG